MARMKFLVTGGLGFIGQSVVRNLLARKIPVIAADQSADPEALATFTDLARSTGARFDSVAMDVGEFRDVMNVFHKHPDITHAIHLAYVMGPLVDENTALSTRVNILGMTHMFEAAVHRKLMRLVFTSSETVHGPSQKPYGERAVTEEDFCDPASHTFTYAVMKLLNEHMGRRYVERHGASIVCTGLRSYSVTAASVARSCGLNISLRSRRSVNLLRLPFGPETRDTWIYKDDCAEQLVRLALKPKLTHFAYNNGGHSVTAAELSAIVRKWLPGAQIGFSAAGGTPLIDNQDGSRLIREIDFTPAPLDVGVRAHINEARSSVGLPAV